MSKIKSVVVNGKEWDKESLKKLLDENDNAVVKAMLKIFEYQTSYEQDTEQTYEHNGVGFSGLMSKFVKFYNEKHYLSPKMMLIARKKMKKYAGQILLIMSGSIEIPASNVNRRHY